nr:ribosomal protein 63, mitochondrial [Onthophagus taurus]
MRLFQALFRRRNLPNGNIYTGKHRLIQQVKPEHIQDLKNKLAIEEKNMFLLRHPYLTPEQSKGHSIALGKQVERMERLRAMKKDFKDHVTLEDRLGHLRYNEAWD